METEFLSLMATVRLGKTPRCTKPLPAPKELLVVNLMCVNKNPKFLLGIIVVNANRELFSL